MRQLNLLQLIFIAPRQRRYWVMIYNQAWFETLWDNRHDTIFAEIWRREFRVTPTTFEFIVDLVRGQLEKHRTNFRQSICIQKRVAVAIWRLSTGNSYRTISKVFGIGKATVIAICRDFNNELTRVAHQFINFPENGRETGTAIQSFQRFCNCVIPQVLGAIDGTHIEILSPDCLSKVDYFSRKLKFTINTQAVIGSNYMFLDVSTGYPGSIHDARMLRASSLFHNAVQGQILSQPVDYIQNVAIRPLLLGDGAYPPATWNVKPYPYNLQLTAAQKKFNKNLSGARSTVERGFGLLKGRWRCLLKRLDNELKNIPNIIITCCVLHNICQMNGDKYIDDDEVLNLVIRNERRARRMRVQNNQICGNAGRLRNLLTDYVDNQ